MITVRTLGKAEIQIGRRKLTPKTETLFALGLHLCARAGERLTRDELAAMFWPDATITRARHSLRQMLYRLRQSGLAVGERAEDLHLQAELVRFDHAEVLAPTELDASAPIAPPPDLTLLPGHRGAFSASYAQWLDGYRASVAARIRRVLNDRMQHLRRHGRWDDVQTVAEAILKTDSLNEEAMLALAESVAMSGSKSMAVALLDRFVENLDSGNPHLSLPASLLRRRISERFVEWAASGGTERPLIGRESHIAVLCGALDSAAAGKGSAIAVVGPPGIGKTRLCGEIQSIGQLRGFQSISIALEAALHPRPFSAVLALLSRLRDLPGAAAVHPSAFAIVARLTGNQSSPVEDLESAPAVTSAHVAWSLAELVSAVSSERRLLLTVEDAHSLDADSQGVLSHLVDACAGLRVLVVLNARHWPQSISSTALRRMPLVPLTREASRRLARESCPPGTSDESLDRIAASSGGNPLFVLELAALTARGNAGNSVPETLQLLIESRLAGTSHSQRRLLRAAALMGPLASLQSLSRVCRSETESMFDLVEPLESDGIVRLNDSGALIIHDCWRAVILAGMGRATSAAMRLECAESLMAHSIGRGHVDALWKAAELFHSGGLTSSGREAYLRIGNISIGRGLCAQATQAFARALECADDALTVAQLEERITYAFAAASQHDESERHALRGLAALSREGAGDPSLRIRLLTALADAQWNSRKASEHTLRKLLVSCQVRGASQSAIAFACFHALRVIFNSKDSTLADEFNALNPPHVDEPAPSLQADLARLIYQIERYDDEGATATLGRLALSNYADLPEHEALRSVRYQFMALRILGQLQEAVDLGTNGYERALLSGFPYEVGAMAVALGYLALDRGRTADAVEWLKRLPVDAPPEMSHLTQELRHLRSRLHLQSGRAEEAFQELDEVAETIFADQAQSRRLVLLANYGLAAATTGREATARRVLDASAEELRLLAPRSVLEFVAEAIARGYAAIDDGSSGLAVASEFIARRRRLTDRPIPPAFTVLRSIGGSNSGLVDAIDSPSNWRLEVGR